MTLAITNAVRKLADVSIVSPELAIYRPLAEIVTAAIQAAAGNSEHTQRAYRTAIGQFIAIDAGQDHIAQAHGCSLRCNVLGFHWIELKRDFAGIRLWHGTEAAASGTEVAENHEGGSAARKTLVNIWAAC